MSPTLAHSRSTSPPQPSTHSLLDARPAPHTPASLLALAAPLSGADLLALAEERALGGACGHALCGAGARLAAAAPAPLPARKLAALAGAAPPPALARWFCGSACEAATHALARRLGGEADALARFAPTATAPARAAPAAPAPAPAAPSPTALAAGSAAAPIMRAAVVERAQPAARAAPAFSRRTGGGSGAVEGYTPRGPPAAKPLPSTAAATARSPPPPPAFPAPAGPYNPPRGALRKTVSWRDEAESGAARPAVARRVSEGAGSSPGAAAGADGSSSSTATAAAPRTAAIVLELEVEDEEVEVEEEGGGGGEAVAARFARLKLTTAGGSGDTPPPPLAAPPSYELLPPSPTTAARDAQLAADLAGWRARLAAEDAEGGPPAVGAVGGEPVWAPPAAAAAPPARRPRTGAVAIPEGASVRENAPVPAPAAPGTPDRAAAGQGSPGGDSGKGAAAAAPARPPRAGSPVSSSGGDDEDDEPDAALADPALWSDVEDDGDYGLGEGGDGAGPASGLGAWLRPPPTGAAGPGAYAPAAAFGRLLAALDGWVTPSTHAWLTRAPVAGSHARPPPPPGPPSDPTRRASHAALAGGLARAAPRLLRAFGGGGGGGAAASIPRSTLEAALAGVAATFDTGPRPTGRAGAGVALTPGEWAVAAAVFAKAASLVAVPALAPWFEGREGVGRLSALLEEEGCGLEVVESLLDVLMGGEGEG